MREIRLTAAANAEPRRVFELVADVAGYPEFIDSCRSAKVTARDGDDISAELMLHIGFADDRYPMRLHLIRPSTIAMRFVGEAPVHLEAEWHFAAEGSGGCRIDLRARYAAAGFSKELLLGPLVRRICSQLLDSVATEAGRKVDMPAAEKGETQ